MSKNTFVSNKLLENEIKALNLYVNSANRDMYNLDVVCTMIDAIKEIAEGLRPSEVSNGQINEEESI